MFSSIYIVSACNAEMLTFQHVMHTLMLTFQHVMHVVYRTTKREKVNGLNLLSISDFLAVLYILVFHPFIVQIHPCLPKHDQ